MMPARVLDREEGVTPTELLGPALVRTLAALDAYAQGPRSGDARAEAAREEDPPRLRALRATFGLTSFERDLLVLSCATALDPRAAEACAAAHGDATQRSPTFALALAALSGAHLSAISRGRPLRRWRLVEPVGDLPLLDAPLRVDERVLHHLLGFDDPDERLDGLVHPVPPRGFVTPDHEAVCERIVPFWAPRPGRRMPHLLLSGDDIEDVAAFASAACAHLGMGLFEAPLDSLPKDAVELAAFATLWDREAGLATNVLLVTVPEGDPPKDARLETLLRSIQAPLILVGDVTLASAHRGVVRLHVPKPTPARQRALWEESFGSTATPLSDALEAATSQFDLPATRLVAIAEEAAAATHPAAVSQHLWRLCRERTRPRVGGFAQPLSSRVGWDDLVLPPRPMRLLRRLGAHLRHRRRVHDDWGFAAGGRRGLGVTALFAGPSGTGKTLAAEVLANVLDLDLYRIDLSQVVNKYIGETEKNLARLFDAAEAGGAILLFDEADALFGKRSEVRDAHDRYANVEVSYLLQRMESYRGLAILTTNLRDALDSAFVRRLRFIVDFPFPDREQRTRMWARAFPPDTPTEGLDPERLATLEVAGGTIRNIALEAAFIAADAGTPVTMRDIAEAARAEFEKNAQPMTGLDLRRWA